MLNVSSFKECHNKIVREEANKPKIKKVKNGKSDLEFKLISEHLTREDKELLETILPKYELPRSLSKLKQKMQLPPSLMPPEFDDFIDYDINTWSSN